jgi:hypothetical protein
MIKVSDITTGSEESIRRALMAARKSVQVMAGSFRGCVQRPGAPLLSAGALSVNIPAGK